MKNLLIGTTALVAAGTLALPAQSAEKIKMTVGGYFLAFMVGGDQDVDETKNLRGFEIARESEIHFKGSTRLDNGIKVGVEIQLEGENGDDQIDESFIYFEGGFGKVIVGAENSAAYLMHYASPAPAHWAHGLNSPGFRHVDPNGNRVGVPSTNPNLTTDYEKITYFTPRFSGVQVGLSYTPDKTQSVSSYSGFSTEKDEGDQGDIVEVGINYVQQFGAVKLALAATGGWTQLEKNKKPTRTDRDVGDDQTEYTVGGQISFSGLTIGAGYRINDNGNSLPNNDTEHFNIGARYTRGAWGVGIQYAMATAEDFNGTARNDHEYKGLEIGGSYNIGSGVQILGGIQFHEYDGNNDFGNAPDRGNNEATVVYIGTALSF